MSSITYEPHEWHLELCKVKEAWQFSINERKNSRGEGIIIAHMDTGWTRHPEIYLNPNYLRNDPNSVSYMNPDPDGTLHNAENHMSGASIWFNHGTSTASVMIGDEITSRTDVLSSLESLEELTDEEKGLYASQMDEYLTQIDNGVQITGVAPNAKILPFRVTEGVIETPYEVNTIPSKILLITLLTYGIDQNTGGLNTLAKAIDKVTVLSKENSEIGVVSISLGGLINNDQLELSLKEARKNGIIVCAAAAQLTSLMGDIADQEVYPGSSPHCIRVAGTYGEASDENEQTDDYAMPAEGFYSESVDFTAPGWGIHTALTEKDGSEISYSINENAEGTSHSTAVTAGICSLWLAHHGRQNLIQKYGRPLLMDAFRYCVDHTCFTPTGWDSSKRGIGIINAKALLEFELPPFGVVENQAIFLGWAEEDWGKGGKHDNWGRIIE